MGYKSEDYSLTPPPPPPNPPKLSIVFLVLITQHLLCMRIGNCATIKACCNGFVTSDIVHFPSLLTLRLLNFLNLTFLIMWIFDNWSPHFDTFIRSLKYLGMKRVTFVMKENMIYLWYVSSLLLWFCGISASLLVAFLEEYSFNK